MDDKTQTAHLRGGFFIDDPNWKVVLRQGEGQTQEYLQRGQESLSTEATTV
jgi:hypothetical protein